jgi:predicted HTH domain antitoxin/antitoxin (DNA-binding transcriptional repressor) of toxin-antitoxin stability system
MEFKRVSKTDLARHTRRVISTVQRGHTAVIESHGEPEAAIVDITDFRILRAVMRYCSQQPEIDVAGGLTDDAIADLSDFQERYNLAMAHYLAGAISLSRAAELLDLPWLDLRTRFQRLDVPLRTAPADLDEAQADVDIAATWSSSQ